VENQLLWSRAPQMGNGTASAQQHCFTNPRRQLDPHCLLLGTVRMLLLGWAAQAMGCSDLLISRGCSYRHAPRETSSCLKLMRVSGSCQHSQQLPMHWLLHSSPWCCWDC
jgi:hypothetical protein